VRQRRLRHYALAARAQHVHLGGLLVGREVRLEEEVLDARVVRGDPGARRRGRLAREVLAGRVARRVVEARVEDAARRVLLDVAQLPGARGGLGGLANLVAVLVEPRRELARLPRRLEYERRRALHR